MAGTVHGDTGRCMSKCAFPHLPIDFFATKMLVWRGFVHQPARAFGGPQRGRNQRLCTMGSQRLAAASPTVNQYDKGACEMVWASLINARFNPQRCLTRSSKESADFGDPLGLALGLPAEYAQLTNEWQQMRPREWTNVDQVNDDLVGLSYKSRRLLLTWWLCQRLAMEKPSRGKDKYMEIPANMRVDSPVDDWLGWANAALQKKLPTCDSATEALKQPVALAFKKCVADGTHDTMEMLLKRLGSNWDALTPDDFPSVAHSPDHAHRRSQSTVTKSSETPLYAKPLSTANADRLAAQWQGWVSEPFQGCKPLSQTRKNVHLSWADNKIADDPHPFAALLAVYRAHKAPAVGTGGATVEVPVVDHPLQQVWGVKLPSSIKPAAVRCFPENSMGAWLAWSNKSDPKIATSFQDGWTFGKDNKRPPLVSYLLAWAASQHIERTCPDWLKQIDQPRTCSLSSGKQANT